LFRISGIKFQGTVGPAYSGSLGEISLDGVSAVPNVRIDNCQFNGLYLRPIVFTERDVAAVAKPIFNADTNFTFTNSNRHSDCDSNLNAVGYSNSYCDAEAYSQAASVSRARAIAEAF
jgi:hypothetical protein